MTTISQSAISSQVPSNPASSVASPSTSSAARSATAAAPSTQAAAGPASARTSYATATRNLSSQSPTSSSSPTAPAVGSAQLNKNDRSSPVNGKVAIPPAVPAVGGPNIINGNTPINSPSGNKGDHLRNPSVTISAAGPPQQNSPNGASIPPKSLTGSQITFGQMYNADGSPRSTNATPHQPDQSGNSLGIHNSANPRITSPANSPSPIPQPSASGGKPPSHGHNGSAINFGAFDRPGANMNSGMPTGPLPPGTQHLRRESSHSQHSDLSNHGMGPGAGRGGYPPQGGGRGRGYGGPQPQYPQQMSYSPQPNYRPPPPTAQGGNRPNMPFQQQQNRNLGPGGYPNSPHQAARSPVPPNAQPAHPQPGPMPMPNAQMNATPYGYPGQYPGYPNMPPQQAYAMGNGYAANDPAYQYQYAHYFNPTAYPMQMPQSPRPPNQMPPVPGQQPNPYGNQYAGPQPSAMSRTSSASLGPERPTSGMGKPPAPPSSTPAPANSSAHNANQPSQSPAPTAAGRDFKIPQKNRASVVIRNPNSGDIVDLKKSSSSASPAPSSKSPAPPSSLAATPPPGASGQESSSHAKTESRTVKSDEEKRAEMKEAIAKKQAADKAEEQQRKVDEAKVADEKVSTAAKAKEEADAKELEAAKKQTEAEEAEKKNKAEAEKAAAAAAATPEQAAPAEETEEAKKAREEQEQEDLIAQWEKEEAEAARKEEEQERAYTAKKIAEKEEAARREAEAFKMADEDMKKAEREAEEAEEAKIKALEEAEGESSQKEREDMFASLRKEGSSTPTSETLEATPAEKEPISVELSMPPPKTTPGSGKQKPAALKLETAKSVEPPQPTPQLQALRTARRIEHINDIAYPAAINSPNPALNANAKGNNMRYDRAFLMQFQRAFTEKPSENWAERLKETVGDTSEPQSARATSARSSGPSSMGMSGGGRQPSNRAPMPVMGAFGQGGRTLPPGTTSQARFEASSRPGAPPSRPTMQNPLAGFVTGRPGAAFPNPAAVKMERGPSSTSMGAHPNSPRNASRGGGGSSQRGSRPNQRREDPKDNKAMPLTAGVNLEPIKITSSGWKPQSVHSSMSGPAPGGDGHMAPDVVQRKVKSNLNKMTPNNFDKISGQILAIAHQSKDETDGRSLRQVIQLTFEKATDEAHWAEMYAQFCRRMLDSMSPEIKDKSILDKKGEVIAGGALFRKYLLTRCQTEFEQGWKINLPAKPEGETKEAALLSDEYYIAAAAKRRGLGLVRFIGELYKLNMLTERIMHECVKKLVDYESTPDEAEVESLTSLLKTIGGQLDGSEKGHSMMDAYFVRIHQMIELPDLASRLRFMLMDTVDLRKTGWQLKGSGVKGPTTLNEVRQQAAEVERQKEAQRIAESARNRGGGGGGRPPIGRGDARAFSSTGQNFGQPPPDYHKTVGMDDLRRLGSKGNTRQASSQGPTFGPTSMFNSGRGSNSRKPISIAQKGDDSGASSRVSTPPAQKEKKEETEAKKSVNTFSALASLENAEATEGGPSPASSPPTASAQPVSIAGSTRSKSPLGKEAEPKEESKTS